METAFAPIEPSSLREQAAAAIRAGIITGEIRPGELYSVRLLAASLRVSATPVREAMLDLAGEGLVEAVRNRGFRIVALTEDDLDEILELRVLLEVPSTGRLAGRFDAESEAQLRAAVESADAAAGAADLASFLAADRLFHLGLLELLGNRRLVELVDRLRNQTRLYGLPDLIASGILASAAGEHRAVLDALVAGDGPEAERVMERHLRETTRGVWTGRHSSA
jgi:DNA-binding GntR family transcriptional regulator